MGMVTRLREVDVRMGTEGRGVLSVYQIFSLLGKGTFLPPLPRLLSLPKPKHLVFYVHSILFGHSQAAGQRWTENSILGCRFLFCT